VIWLIITSGGILLMATMSVSSFFLSIKMFGIPHISITKLLERRPNGHER